MIMENLHSGIYRRLKDRGLSVTDKIKLVKFAWKSDRVIIPNKEQVLIDFICGLLLNKKRNNLSESDVVKIWICFCEILNSRKIFQKTSETQIIIVKPSICQVINDRLSVEVDKNCSDDISIVSHVLGCCFAVLVSPALSYIYSTKLDYMINLLSAVVKLTVKNVVNKTIITQTQVDLLRKCIDVYRTCQRGHPNQKQVLQLFVEKLFVPSVTLRFLYRSMTGSHSDGLDMYHHGYCPDGLGHCVDGLMNVLEESLFNKDHNVSYDMYLSIICGSGELKSQPPKVIENIFTVMSNCIYGKVQLTYVTTVLIQKSFTEYLPVFFKAFLENECHGDNTIAHWLFSHICSVIGLKSNTSDLCGPLQEPVVLGVISRMLLQIQKCDVYSITEDKAAENTQLKYYRHILDVVLKCKISPEFYGCLLHLFQLNHEILEPNLTNIFQSCWLSVSQSSDEDTVQALDLLLTEIVSTYSKLRQIGRWLDKLLLSVTSSNRVDCLLIPSKFSSSFRTVIHALPQSTMTDLWKKFVDMLKDECLPQLFYNGDEVWIRRLQDTVTLFHLYMMNIKIADYSITDITSQRVTQIINMIPTDIIKPLVDVAVEQKKHDLLTSVLLLCYSWGEVYMLLNQYKCDVVQDNQAHTSHISTLHCVHKYVTEDIWTKIHNFVLKTKDYRSCHLWDLLLGQELRFSLCAQTIQNTDNKSHIADLLCQILSLPSEVTDKMMTATWDSQFQSITIDNSVIAKWDLIIHHLPLVISVLSVTQSKTLSDFVVHVLTKSFQSKNIRIKEDTECLSLQALTEGFLKSGIVKEFGSLQSSLVTTVMSEVRNKMVVPKPKSPKRKKSSMMITEVMALLHMLTDEDITWDKEVDSEQLNYLQKMAKKVSALIVCDDEVMFPGSIPELSLYLEILSVLPLSQLSVTNQLRCVYGILTILRVTALQQQFFSDSIDARSLSPEKLQTDGGNGESREIITVREPLLFCIDLLTVLIESIGLTPLFQLLDNCAYWEWIYTLYNTMHDSSVLLLEKIDLLVEVTWHSIFKDFQVVMNMSPCIKMIEDKLLKYGTETKQNLVEKKNLTMSPELQIFAALLEELEKILSRAYLKEEIKRICQNYYKDLVHCLNLIVTNIRKSNCHCPAILVKCYCRILYLSDADDMDTQKITKKNFIYMISVCTRWLTEVKMPNLDGVQDLLHFMNSVFKQDKKLSSFYKDDIKLVLWNILTDLLTKLLQFDSNMSAHSLSSDENPLGFISDRVVCLIQKPNNAKESCKNMNQLLNIDKKSEKHLMSSEKSKALQQCHSYRKLKQMLIHEGEILSQRSKVIMLQVQEVIGSLTAACSKEQFRLVSDDIVQNISAENLLENPAKLSSYLYLWKQLLQSQLSEDKYDTLCNAVQSVMVKCQSIIQLHRDLDVDSFLTDIAVPVLDLQVLMLNYGPQLMSPQTAVLSLHSCQDLPLEGALFIPSFHAVYEVLNSLLVHHTNTVLEVIPAFINCSKRLLTSVIHESSQEKLSSDPRYTQEVVICAQFVDRFFENILSVNDWFWPVLPWLTSCLKSRPIYSKTAPTFIASAEIPVRLFMLITTYKVEFCKVASYLVADYVTEVQQVTVLPVIKKVLVPAVYKLLDICDKYSVAQLHAVLKPGVKEVFKLLYTDYMKYHKYTGKI